ncbi:hypothetical protein [Streptomyces sp. DH24]|uniref:hypothetical protein n=1 Tax=Streptomyces sp. DH24 TaxID=3040123 RepID=UPI002442EA7F|nr:hypothetical protein [Streptomyces sp. DH24]MDG9720681.1 hypothetical protein [Streptomyces sp. DH24]
MTQGLDRAMDVLVVAAGLGCVWLGCRAVFQPRRPPEPIHGPVWVVRAWGLGFVLLGIALTIETVTLMTGGESGWTADVIRWVAGPLVVGSIVMAHVARGWQRHRARTMKGGRRA